MAEYEIAFGKRLAETARLVMDQGSSELDAQRTVLYLSLLSTEISLKAMLERAGKPVPEIRGHSHRLSQLLSDLGSQCEVVVELSNGAKRQVSTSRIRSLQLDFCGVQITVGAVLDGESKGASVYPNQIRYGESLQHFPVEIVVQMAEVVSRFAYEHFDSIGLKR